MLEKFSFKVDASLFWIIFWAIFFFPIALLLLFLNGEFSSTDHRYYIDYNGSTFWLCFWMIIFFPISILLIMFNGLTLCKESKSVAV
ncbi:MAG: hypothetical protein KDD46_02040 [Bdellovibrionales bacterium]|nr:hypothetical protein [Bdellovibrionales bacterium]